MAENDFSREQREPREARESREPRERREELVDGGLPEDRPPRPDREAREPRDPRPPAVGRIPITNTPVVERTQTFWVIICFAVLQIIVGAFVLYGNTQISSVQDRQRAFTNCQAQYNQDFRETYDDINASSRAVSAGLYGVISLIPRLLDKDTTPAELEKFREAAENYTKVYNELEAKRKATNYPAPPENFCGQKP